MSYQRTTGAQLAWQKSGIGDYDRVGDWAWQFYPPPYNFLAPQDSTVQKPFGPSGLGCGGSCGCGCSQNQGLGQGLFNTGLFTSANPSTWGWGEWVAVALGLYAAGSIIGDAGRSASGAAKVGKKYSRKAKKAAGGGFTTVASALAVAGIAYVGYQYITSQQSGAATAPSTAVATQ